jgi:hypothetical protein
MMQLAVPKQNGCQKCVVQLDTKANERRGSLFQFLRPTQGNSRDEFLGLGEALITVKVISCCYRNGSPGLEPATRPL